MMRLAMPGQGGKILFFKKRIENMKIGIGSYAFRYAIGHSSLSPEKRMTLRSLLQFCNQNKVEVLQICDNINMVELHEKELQSLAEYAHDKKIEIELGTIGYAPERISSYLKYCQLFNARILRAVLNAASRRDNLKGIVCDLRKEIPLLEEANVTLAIENHFDLTPTQLAWIMREIDHPLIRICMDPLNSISLLWGINETLDQLLPFVVSAHVKDVVVERQGAGFYIKGCPIGEGQADTEGYIRKIKETHPYCNIFIEQWMNPEQAPEMTLKTERRWVLDGLKFLNERMNSSSEMAVSDPNDEKQTE